jgi:Fe-S-cluster-containing dehydrogenase component
MTARTATVTPPAFLHDLNACVGCHACALACINEHALAPGRFWRQIVTFNPERRPGLPTHHLSIGCNHCLDAPCERACPALAISRDPGTGAVLIAAGSCIGCRYCGWVCPYDAPKFDETLGIMQKCTLCAHRLGEGGQPACVSQCPTGALRLSPYDEHALRDVPGFPQFPARPAIAFVPLRPRRLLAVHPDPVTEADDGMAEFDRGAGAGHSAPPKLGLRSDWALATFTCLAILLAAWQAAAALGGPSVRPAPLLGLGAIAMAVSSTHLGRPRRAWRAVLNWRRSWLSREVIALPLFLTLAVTAAAAVLRPASAAAGLPLPPGSSHLGAAAVIPTALLWVAVAAAVSLLVSIDRVYASMATRGIGPDQGAALTSAAFLAGVFSGTPWLVAFGGALRLAAAAARPFLSRVSWTPHRQARTVVRITVGLGVPCGLWLAGGNLVVAAWCVVVGEALDRADFYDALDVVTPASVADQALLEAR